jgi:uncharacterized UPF0160 family protein
MKIVTHDSKFHGDEIFALSVLKLVYPNAQIIRTREKKILDGADIIIDVGGKFDNEKYFDHHQNDFFEKRKNELPFASAGLIWKKFWNKITSFEVYNYLDKKIFQFIDADDSGLQTYTSNECETYTIVSMIDGMNIIEKKSDNNFFFVLDFVTKLLKNEIRKAEKIFEGKKIIEEKLKTKEEFIVLEEYIPWREWLIDSKIKFIVYKGTESRDWCSSSVYSKKTGYERKAYFPEKWGGLTNEELEKTTGVNDAVFCHKERFICVAKTKEGAIELTKLALKNEKRKI